jgi:hypothetical protein
VLVVATAVAVGGPGREPAEAAPEAPPLPFDFDGDGDEELVIGAPGRSFGYFSLPPVDQAPTDPAVGRIQVLNGDLADTDTEYMIDQNTLAGLDQRESYDEYGYTFVGGDFNGDGFWDLAAGVPAEDLTGPGGIDLADAGAVEIYYGSSTGLQRGQGDFSQFLHRGSAPVGGTLHSFDRFGEALTPGDFDDDGYTDLAIGVSLAEHGQIRNAGEVDILFGSENGLGLGTRPTQRLDRTQWADNAADLDRFGSNLTTGDFNGDGVDDLAVGSQSEPLDPLNGGGFVEVLYGTSTGISVHSPAPQAIATEPSFLSLIYITVNGQRFGWDLEAGDFDNDGDDELAIGAGERDRCQSGGGRIPDGLLVRHPTPNASHVNYGPSDVAPNAVLAPFGQADEFCIFTLAETDLLVDLGGFAPSGEQPQAVTPARLLETRVGANLTTVDGQAEGIGRRGAGTTYELAVAGRGGVPDHATSVLLNVTAIRPSAAGFLTVFPCGPTSRTRRTSTTAPATSPRTPCWRGSATAGRSASSPSPRPT